MTKSSEVLRLAADYVFCDVGYPLSSARFDLSVHRCSMDKYLDMVSYSRTYGKEHEIMALCLAAAIAESEGD